MKYGKEKSEQVAVPPKKPYRTPQLTVHGTVKKITGQQDPPPGKPTKGAPDVFTAQPFT
jgi:hypothetical protein